MPCTVFSWHGSFFWLMANLWCPIYNSQNSCISLVVESFVIAKHSWNVFVLLVKYKSVAREVKEETKAFGLLILVTILYVLLTVWLNEAFYKSKVSHVSILIYDLMHHADPRSLPCFRIQVGRRCLTQLAHPGGSRAWTHRVEPSETKPARTKLHMCLAKLSSWSRVPYCFVLSVCEKQASASALLMNATFDLAWLMPRSWRRTATSVTSHILCDLNAN